MMPQTVGQSLLTRDRVIVLSGLAAVASLAWAYMFYLAADMDDMAMVADVATPQMRVWTAVDLILLFLMWAVMMVAMMVPSAAPLILVVAGVNRRRRERDDPLIATAVFAAGYLLVWTAFSAVATVAQWALHVGALLSPMMVATSPILGAAILIAAGVFQFTPLKHACLAHCRSPFGFIMSHWREGRWGALRMGLAHGSYCVGCCWTLMALLFVAGVMNLLWVAAIAIFVLAEKVLPCGELVGLVAGGVLVLAGVGILFA